MVGVNEIPGIGGESLTTGHPEIPFDLRRPLTTCVPLEYLYDGLRDEGEVPKPLTIVLGETRVLRGAGGV